MKKQIVVLSILVFGCTSNVKLECYNTVLETIKKDSSYSKIMQSANISLPNLLDAQGKKSYNIKKNLLIM